MNICRQSKLHTPLSDDGVAPTSQIFMVAVTVRYTIRVYPYLEVKTRVILIQSVRCSVSVYLNGYKARGALIGAEEDTDLFALRES
jgi:hypothetical protein